MNRSPLIYSCALVASLSLLSTSSAWSAPEPLEASKAATATKAKTVKSKTKKARAHKAKTVNKATPVKVAALETQKPVSPVASSVTTNPYLISQPVAILPKAANPYLVNSGITPMAAASVETKPVVTMSTAAATAVHAPVVAAPVVVPASVAPIAVAPVAAPVKATPISPVQEAPVIVTAVPSAVKPLTMPQPASAMVQAPVAVMPASAPVPAYQPWSSAAGNRNPYLSYQQPYVPVDPGKLFGQFGDGLKMALPTLPSMPNLVPNWSANPAQRGGGDIANTLNGLFASLKMMLPLTGDSNILPTIKKVYPTGEKPLVVINFKCPTEVIGVTPPPMKLLHEAVNLGFDGINKTNLLSFNLQQVCS